MDKIRKLSRDTLEGARHRKAAVAADLDQIREADGYDSWRRQVGAGAQGGPGPRGQGPRGPGGPTNVDSVHLGFFFFPCLN